jgi:hypothetical protein
MSFSGELHLANHKIRRAGMELGTGQSAAFTSAVTLTNSHSELVQFDASGGAFTIFLPASPYDGQTYHLSEIAGNATALTVDGNGKTINGAATLTMNAAFRQRKLRYSALAAQWIVIGGI